MKRFWRWFWRPSSKYTWGGIFIIGGAAGIIFWGGFNTFMEYTNTLQFCISCHEMEQNVYQEYKTTIHYKNRTGVRVICSDCHVPKEWTPKLIRKIKASNELFHKVLGSINTKEKFEAKRLELAENVWAAMKANDSHECRNCHSFEAMDFKKQKSRPRQKHPKAMKQGKTCIDCHKGIAHKLPEGYEEEDD
jgi:nitrate/nitrite reductase NapC/NirT family c-type cytochrome